MRIRTFETNWPKARLNCSERQANMFSKNANVFPNNAKSNCSWLCGEPRAWPQGRPQPWASRHEAWSIQHVSSIKVSRYHQRLKLWAGVREAGGGISCFLSCSNSHLFFELLELIIMSSVVTGHELAFRVVLMQTEVGTGWTHCYWVYSRLEFLHRSSIFYSRVIQNMLWVPLVARYFSPFCSSHDYIRVQNSMLTKIISLRLSFTGDAEKDHSLKL